MELSPLLILGVVLLVVVVGLSLWQSAQQVDRSGAAGPVAASGGAARPAAAATDAADQKGPSPFSTDPLLGDVYFDDEGGVWSADHEREFGDTTVNVEVHGKQPGLTDAQRDILRAALDQHRDLDARARALIRQELDRQGIGETTMEAYELSVRRREDGREAGFVWYDVEKSDREMGVSSTDGWETLRLEILS